MLDRNAIDKAVLTQKENASEQWPNIAPFYTDISCSASHLEVSSFTLLFMISLIVAFAIGAPAVIFLAYNSFSILNEQKSVMSEKTYRMHRQLLITLIFQLLVPTITLFAPYSIVTAFIIAGAEDFGWLSQTSIILGSLHSTLNTCMMLYFIQPYRLAVLKVFKLEAWLTAKPTLVHSVTP
uniref:G protein-coupled receptor n=1 Tax=Panagrolaimus davidi TaxID=227884 RepID=A0A914P2M7_9BILA